MKRYSLIFSSLVLGLNLFFQAFSGLGCVPVEVNPDKDKVPTLKVVKDVDGKVYIELANALDTSKAWEIALGGLPRYPTCVLAYCLNAETRAQSKELSISCSRGSANSQKVAVDLQVTKYPASEYKAGDSVYARYSCFSENQNAGGPNYNTVKDVSASNVDNATPPIAPTSLSASESGSTIELSWTDNSTNETGFTVERSPNGADTFTVLTTTNSNITTYVDNTVLADTAYDYRVKAVRGSASSDYTLTETATSFSPTAPTGLSIFTAGPTNFNLTWSLSSSQLTTLEVERSLTTSTGFTTLESIDTGSNNYSDTSSKTAATTYFYRIKVTKGTFTAYSSEVSETTP